MTHAYQPDSCIGVSSPELLRRLPIVLMNHEVRGHDINGDELAGVLALQGGANALLTDLLSATDDCFAVKSATCVQGDPTSKVLKALSIRSLPESTFRQN